MHFRVYLSLGRLNRKGKSNICVAAASLTTISCNHRVGNLVTNSLHKFHEILVKIESKQHEYSVGSLPPRAASNQT